MVVLRECGLKALRFNRFQAAGGFTMLQFKAIAPLQESWYATELTVQ